MKIIQIVNFLFNHPLTKNNKYKTLLKFIKWQIVKKLLPGPYVVDFAEKSKIIIAPKSYSAVANYYVGLNEFEEMSFLLHSLDSESIFIDVGANIGSYTLLASSEVCSKSISFEPCPATFNNLKINCLINDLGEKVTLYNKACGAKTEKKRITTTLGPSNYIIKDEQDNSEQTIDVDVVRLDDVIDINQKYFLKIDVEGFEAHVLKGSERLLSTNNIMAIIIELNGLGNKYGSREEDIYNYLVGLGYTCCYYNPFERTLTSIDCSKKFNERPNKIFIYEIDYILKIIKNRKKYIINGCVI